MKVEDFINNQNINNNKKNHHSEYRDLNDWTMLSSEKKELIESVRSYLIEEEFIDILHLYNDFKYPIFDTGYIQTLDDDAIRCLKSIRLSWEGRNDYSPSIVISEEDFLKKYNEIYKCGSQKYTSISLKRYKYDEELGFLKIFYTLDGRVFINSDGEVAMAYWDINDLGERLANVCRYHADFARNQNEQYKLRMTKNYRHIK